jgi:transposase InsO family protein
VEEHLSSSEVARQLGVPYTTALEWVRRYRAGGAAALEPATAAIEVKSSPRAEARRAAIVATKAAYPQAGHRRIRDVMQRFLGIGTSATTVRRVLKAEGSSAPRTQVKARAKPRRQRFERAEPNQLWQSDLFTFLLRRHERLYLVAFLDDHSRYLVSWALAHHQRSTLVLEALARGIAEYGAPREILTDQGRQYTAWRGSTEFEAELRRQGIAHVKSRPHHPQTCGKIERFWKTLWEELLCRTVCADFEDCQRRIGLFVQHYNFQRPHQALEGLTPADRFFRAGAPVRAAIEAQVAANALRLAREQPLRKPFYLAGRLGDRDLSISASGAALTVRVGDEQTMIPFSKESDDEELTSSSRWHGGREAAEAPAPPATEVVEELQRDRSDGAQSHADAAVGVVGGDTGDGRDCTSEDLARDVLPPGDAGVAGDARGDEPARRQCAQRSRDGSVGGDGADRAAGEPAQAAGTGQAPQPASAAADPQVAAHLGEDEPSRPPAEDTHLDHDRYVQGGREPDDGAWRKLALRWERTLCAEDAVPRRMHGEKVDERAQVELHADAEGARGAAAASGGDRGSVGGVEDGLGSGPCARPVAQSLPDDPASRRAESERVDHAQERRPSGEAARDRAVAGAAATAATAQRAPAEAGRCDAAPVGGGGRTVARSVASDGATASHAQEHWRGS